MRRKRRKNKQMKFIMITSLSLLFILTVGYAAFSTNLNITAKGNIKEKSRIIKSWTSESNEDFHTDFYRENIITATFLDTNKVPDNAVESWDVSEAKDKGVMAYVIPSTSNPNKYDLFIGATRGVVANEDSSNLFFKFTSITSIEFNNNFDTSKVTNMSNMFVNCREIITLDLSSFDTSNVTHMINMFVSTLEVNPMKIVTIKFGEKFVTNNVTRMDAMFGNCSSLVNLDVSHFDTSKVTNMHDMFASCLSLTYLDVSHFDTSKVTDMGGMFHRCQNITNLNLCSFDTQNVTNMKMMFSGTTKLNKITVGSKWTTTNAETANMFYNTNISSVTTGQC